MTSTQRAAMLSLFRFCETPEGFHRLVQVAMTKDDAIPFPAENLALWAVAFGIKPGRGARFPHWRTTGAIADSSVSIHSGFKGHWRLYTNRSTHVLFNPRNPALAISNRPQIIGRIITPEDCRELLFGIYGDRRHLIYKAFKSWQVVRGFTPEMASAWPSRITGVGDALINRWKQLRNDEEGITDDDFSAMLSSGDR